MTFCWKKLSKPRLSICAHASEIFRHCTHTGDKSWFLPLLVVSFNTRWQCDSEYACTWKTCKKGYYLHVIDQYSSHFYPLDTPEPMFYADEHCGGASAAGEGPVALPNGGRHLLSHAREIHLQSACQKRWSNPEVIQPVTHRHSFIIQQQQSSIWLAVHEPLYLFDFFKKRVNILVLNAFV